ncbi:MAG: preprotein translocase subunit SecG [Treponema sp.]|jgi:preprotein translocase subunit SecG|nr:preprotein translocase subunit SecG [Treponema sp.]
MGILTVVLLVFFIITAVLLVLMVLVQNEEGDGLGGIFAGGSGSAFGSRSGNVLTRTTSVLGALFLVISLSLALLSRTPAGSGVEDEGRRLSDTETDFNWLDDEANKALQDESESGDNQFEDFMFDWTPDTGEAVQ